MTLQLSDLFQKTGHKFDWTQRVEDQKALIERLREYSPLQPFADDLQEFCGEGIASMNYLEYILIRIIKVCVQHNIGVS